MGAITLSENKFKSAADLYAKIKRQWQSFDAVNILDDTDFPLYTSEVLIALGAGALKEEHAVITIKNNKGQLPKDFKILHAAYKCSGCHTETTNRVLQNTSVFENDVTKEVFCRANKCDIDCETKDHLIERITIRQYVNDYTNQYTYNNISLLRLSPNVKQYCIQECPNINCSSPDEITINNGCVFTNFSDGDIYIQYYAFPYDEDGMPLIPDSGNGSIEKAVEWYIKWQVMLNYWLVDDLANAQNKWQKAEQEYEKAFAEAKYYNKVPSFSAFVNSLRNQRSINKNSFFGQIDRKNSNRRY